MYLSLSQKFRTLSPQAYSATLRLTAFVAQFTKIFFKGLSIGVLITTVIKTNFEPFPSFHAFIAWRLIESSGSPSGMLAFGSRLGGGFAPTFKRLSIIFIFEYLKFFDSKTVFYKYCCLYFSKSVHFWVFQIINVFPRIFRNSFFSS